MAHAAFAIPQDTGGAIPGTIHGTEKVLTADFGTQDRIPAEHLRDVEAAHEAFLRSLAPGLCALLGCSTSARPQKIEQLTYSEFLKGLPAPASVVGLSLRPYGGNAALALSPSLVFPVLELLLGAKGTSSTNVGRELTDIEASILQVVLEIIAEDLRLAWRPIGAIEFGVGEIEALSRASRILNPGEPVLVFTAEVQIGDAAGKMRLAMPSILLRIVQPQQQNQQGLRPVETGAAGQERMLRLLGRAGLRVDIRLQGARLSAKQLVALKEGDILTFSYPVDKLLDCMINGKLKYKGLMIAAGNKMSFRVEERC